LPNWSMTVSRFTADKMPKGIPTAMVNRKATPLAPTWREIAPRGSYALIGL
jgi:hypothetical protein